MGMPALLSHVQNILGLLYVEDQLFWDKSWMSSLRTGSQVSLKFRNLTHTFSHTAILQSVYPTLSDFLRLQFMLLEKRIFIHLLWGQCHAIWSRFWYALHWDSLTMAWPIKKDSHFVSEEFVSPMIAAVFCTYTHSNQLRATHWESGWTNWVSLADHLMELWPQSCHLQWEESRCWKLAPGSHSSLRPWPPLFRWPAWNTWAGRVAAGWAWIGCQWHETVSVNCGGPPQLPMGLTSPWPIQLSFSPRRECWIPWGILSTNLKLRWASWLIWTHSTSLATIFLFIYLLSLLVKEQSHSCKCEWITKLSDYIETLGREIEDILKRMQSDQVVASVGLVESRACK